MAAIHEAQVTMWNVINTFYSVAMVTIFGFKVPNFAHVYLNPCPVCTQKIFIIIQYLFFTPLSYGLSTVGENQPYATLENILAQTLYPIFSVSTKSPLSGSLTREFNNRGRLA